MAKAQKLGDVSPGAKARLVELSAELLVHDLNMALEHAKSLLGAAKVIRLQIERDVKKPK